MKAKDININNMPTDIMKANFKKFLKLMKNILFVIMLLLTFFISQKLTDLISTMDINLMQQVINVVLAVVVVGLYLKK